jgi:hypothetical protein
MVFCQGLCKTGKGNVSPFHELLSSALRGAIHGGAKTSGPVAECYATPLIRLRNKPHSANCKVGVSWSRLARICTQPHYDYYLRLSRRINALVRAFLVLTMAVRGPHLRNGDGGTTTVGASRKLGTRSLITQQACRLVRQS